MGIFLRCLAFLLAAAAPAAAQAQGGWPAKPVRIVVAYPPGGGIDVMSRQIAEKLTAALNSPVRKEMRADFKAFPAYAGKITHYPMATQVLRTC